MNKKQFITQIDAFSKLRKGWNSYEAKAPNKTARENAKIIVNALPEKEQCDTKVFPSSDDGVGGYMYFGEYRFHFECSNNGEVGIALYQNDKLKDSFDTKKKDIDKILIPYIKAL